MKKRKDIITVAIDSPAAAGAGTQAKLIAKHYKLQHLDTGSIYRLIGKLKLENSKKFNYSLIRKKIKNLNMNSLQNKELLSDKVAVSASIIAKTARDIFMIRLGEKFPRYKWNKNFGYGTAEHLNEIKKYGITKHHRKTFKPIHNILMNKTRETL